MFVQFALFHKDKLLQRGAAHVTTEAQCAHLDKFHVAHQLVGDVARIVLSDFALGIDIKTAALEMPVHQSDDWESIELSEHTFAFRCTLDA